MHCLGTFTLASRAHGSSVSRSSVAADWKLEESSSISSRKSRSMLEGAMLSTAALASSCSSRSLIVPCNARQGLHRMHMMRW